MKLRWIRYMRRISYARKTYSIQGSCGGKKIKHRDIKSAKNDIGISPSKWIQDH